MEEDLLDFQPKNKITFRSIEINLQKNLKSRHQNSMGDMDIHQAISIASQLINII